MQLSLSRELEPVSINCLSSQRKDHDRYGLNSHAREHFLVTIYTVPGGSYSLFRPAIYLNGVCE